jgi:hypothetical protein
MGRTGWGRGMDQFIDLDRLHAGGHIQDKEAGESVEVKKKVAAKIMYN